MGTIRFVLREDKPDKDGCCAIQLIYQISGQRKYFRTKKKLRNENWHSDKQEAVYLDKKNAKKLFPLLNYNEFPSLKEIQELNSDLMALRKEISDIETLFELSKIVYSPEKVISRLKENHSPISKTAAPSNELFHFIDKYIEDHKMTRERGSLTVYSSLKNHLHNFQKDKSKKICFDNIDYSFFQEFQSYLITPRKVFVPSKNPQKEGNWKIICLNNTTVAKQLSTIKTFLNYARVQGIEVSSKYKDFKIKKETLEVIALTQEELETLFYLDLSTNKKLEQIRDVFCFSCATGLRYSDLSQLKREHIKEEEISITVKKTKEPLTVPLNPYSNFILEKYKKLYRPLPVISNQKSNQYIKELCKLAEINEPTEIVRFSGTKREANTYPKYELVSVHTGRKTFATLSLEKGMSAEEVMEIGGWRDYKSFKRYVKVTEQRKKIVMKKAWGETLRIQGSLI